MPTLQFFGWWRPPGAAAVSSGTPTAGRLTARLTLTARDVDQPSDAATRNVAYDLFGPGDVTGLGRGAVVHTYPSPGAANVEVEKAVYAELGAPDLPWRHSVALPQGKVLRPWIVLLVGTPEEIEVAGATVRLQPSVLDAHPLATSARGADVEDDGSRRIARLIRRGRSCATVTTLPWSYRHSPPPVRRRGRHRPPGRSSSPSITTGPSTPGRAGTSP